MPLEYNNPSVAPLVSVSDDPNSPVTNKIITDLRRMRYFRKQYDQRRAYFYRQYLSQRDQRFYPDNITPRANTFVPYPLSNVETIVARTLDAYFSNEDWFECRGRSSHDEPAAINMGMVLQKLLKEAGFVQAFEEFTRNCAIYGFAGMKVVWDWDFDYVTYSEPIPLMNPETGQPMMQPVPDPMTGQPSLQPIIIGHKPARKPVPRCKPRFVNIDIYDLLVDPDGGIAATLTERTLGQMKREQAMSLLASQQDASKKPLYDQKALDTLVQRVADSTSPPDNPDDVVIRLAEYWNEYDQTMSVLTYGEDAEAISWKDLRASYRAAGYSPYKRKVYAGTPLLMYHGENQFMHKKVPILYTSFIKVPNERFGLGAIEIISDLTESLNKFVNMITDNWNLGINRRYAYDTNADIDHDSLNNFSVPGGRVGVTGDPSKVIMPLPFFTPNAGDYQVLDLYKGMIEMTSGVSDFYSKAVGSPTGNRTATGISSIMNESNFRFKMFIRNLEMDVLQPLLNMCSSMIQQYMTDQVEVQITGDNPAIKKWVVLQPEELVGTLDFNIVGPNYASNRMIQQRNLMALFNMVAQSPYLNQYEAFKELFKVFEIRNIDKMLYPPQVVQQMQQEQQAQQIKMMMLESMLQVEGKARMEQSKPTMGKTKDGRPTKMQFEGKIPGAGLQGPIRELAQSMGANGMGLEGLGQVPGAE